MEKKVNEQKSASIIISIFLVILTISMPITFTILQPEIDFVKGEIKQNPIVDSLANVLTIILSKVIEFFDVVPSAMAQQQEFGCCEVMKNGAKCQISLEEECQSDWHKDQSCDVICQIGCCIDSQGMCTKQAISTQCLIPPALRFIANDPMCQQDPLCKYGCCTVGYQKIWTTNLTCVMVYNGVWDDTVLDELTCINQAYEEERGCCSSYAGCQYITGAECNAKRGSFFANRKCYEISTCNCTLKENEGKCVEGFPDLYKVDTCGNVYVDEIKERCGDGFCNPETNKCESGACSNIYKNVREGFGPKQSTETAKNGESWCVYDTVLDLGNGTAPMGSRHWRHYCLYGKEYVEPCADYRQEVCGELQCVPLEGSTTSPHICGSKTSQSECQEAGCMWLPIKQAYCMPNRWRECFNITDEEECNKHGSCFWWTDFQTQVTTLSSLGLMPYYDLKINEAKNNWISFSKNKRKYDSHELPLCLPKYPPGFNDDNKATMCALGNYFCQYKEEWWGLDTENKECEKEEFYELIAHTCRSIGDCGIYLNYLGKNTTGLKILEVEKPQEGQDPAERIKKEIAAPRSYSEFVNAMKEFERRRGEVRDISQFIIGVLEVLGPISIIRWLTPIQWGILSFKSYSGHTLVGIIGSTLVAVGIILILISLLMPIGPARGAVQAAGTALITGGTLALATSMSVLAITGIAAAVGVFIFVLYLLGYEEKFYMIQCNPSLPPVGGEDCHVCNEDPWRPCTKYRCESLGQACMFNDTITIGNKAYKLADAECIAIQNDGAAPWITEIEVKDLQGNSYKAEPSTTTGPTTISISKIDGSEIPDGTSVIIKIKLNEKALCMWDIESTPSISEMDFYYESAILRDELRQQFLVKQALPFYYVRCADAYGNANVAEYVFKFLTTTGPDLTPPVILGTDRDYNQKFGYGTTELPLSIYVNENASCRWAKQDIDYNLMDSRTECKTKLISSGWRCDTTLTGLESEPAGIANIFYIRCKDSAGNAMQQSYQLMLYPTSPLLITSIKPEDGSRIKSCEIKGVELEVETAEGAADGKATCYWKNQTMIDFIRFTLTDNVTHKTNVSATTQTIIVKCVDSTLNVAQNSTSFTVEIDNTAPTITRIYKEGSQLVLRTDEKATCVYHYRMGKKADCNFIANHTLQAREFDYTNALEHKVAWDDEPWYVKCYDECGNVGDCIIIWPSDIE